MAISLQRFSNGDTNYIAKHNSNADVLEAAVAGCPLIVGYRTSRWTHALARRLVRIPHIGLVNVVAERQVAPEFVQDALEPRAMAEALTPLLTASDLRARMLEDLADVRRRLGTAGAASRTAEMVARLAS